MGGCCGSRGGKGSGSGDGEKHFSIALDYHHPVVWALVSLVFVGAHVMFFLGQYLVLWEIRILVDTENVTVDCPNVLDFHLNDTNYEQQLQKYSYAQIVKALWDEHVINAPFANIKFNVVSSSRMFAGIIILFSGVWPHAKLVATHALWYRRTRALPRTRALLWLEFFGKWSFVDVIATVVAITVFSLSFDGSTQHFAVNLFNGATTWLDTMVDPAALSHVVCHGLSNWSEPKYNVTPVPSPSPNGCHNTVVPIVTDDVEVQELLEIVNATCSPMGGPGGGFYGHVHLALQADTLEGIYYFSSAVWLSLLLSACINMRNEVILIRRFRRRHGGDVGDRQLRNPGASFASGISDNSEFREFLLDKAEGGSGSGSDSGGGGGGGGAGQHCDTLFGHAGLSWLWNAVVLLCVAAGIGMLYVVQFVPIMQRDIAGSLRHTLDWINNETDSEYAEYDMWSNAINILAGEGTDPFLEKDLVIFTILGPGFCLFFSLVVAAVPLPRAWQWVAAKLAGLGFTFSGIEVLAFAALICTTILPVQSGDLVNTDITILRLCQVMDHLYGIGQEECFYEEYGVLLPAFFSLPALFLLTAALNWAVHHATAHCYPTGTAGTAAAPCGAAPAAVEKQFADGE